MPCPAFVAEYGFGLCLVQFILSDAGDFPGFGADSFAWFGKINATFCPLMFTSGISTPDFAYFIAIVSQAPVKWGSHYHVHKLRWHSFENLQCISTYDFICPTQKNHRFGCLKRDWADI